MNRKNKIGRTVLECRDFYNIDEHIDALTGWDVEMSQLESGRYTSWQLSLSADDFQYIFFRQNRKVLNRGRTPGNGFQFCIPLVDTYPPHYLHHQIDRTAICCVPCGLTINAVMPAGFEGATLFVTNTFYHQLLHQQAACPATCDPGDGISFYYPTGKQLHTLRNLLTSIYQRFLKHSTVSPDLEMWLSGITEKQVIPQLLDIMTYTSSAHIKPRPDLFRDTLQMILNNLDSPPTINELASSVGTSERNLQYLFKHNLGMSPKQFAKLYRLNIARRRLWQSRRQRGAVADIANELGYWHMGGFARDFRQLFDITPSDLLARYTTTDQTTETDV